MCEADTFQVVRGRMSCSDLQVHQSALHAEYNCSYHKQFQNPQHELSPVCRAQVHEVEDGDHGLKVHAGKDSQSQTAAALQQVTSAICAFANRIENTAVPEVAGGISESHSQELHNRTVPDKPKAVNKRKAAATTQTGSKKVKP